MNQLLVVVPTYNEAKNINHLIEKIFFTIPDAHILFVDDGSKDGTREHIKNHAKFNLQIFIIERSCKLGLGTAYLAGFKWAIEQNSYSVVCQMDGDLSHNPMYLPQFLNLIAEYDVVIGSRYIKGGGVINWSFVRKCISRLGSLYARCILRMKIQDLTGGFNMWRIHALKRIPLTNIRSEGYSFQIELKYRAQHHGFHLVEHPIVFQDRIAGKSKMSLKICFEAFYRVLLLRI